MPGKQNRIKRNYPSNRESISGRASASTRTSLKMNDYDYRYNMYRRENRRSNYVSQNQAGRRQNVQGRQGRQGRQSREGIQTSRAGYSQGWPGGESQRYGSPYSNRRQRERPRRSYREKNKSPRKSSGKGAQKFAIGIFIIIFAYVSVVAYKFVTKAQIPYDSVIYGSVDTVKTITGIIIRDEKVYNSPSNGTVSFNVADLEKVRKGDIICTVKDEAVVGSIEQELKDINKDILAIQESRDELSAFSEDIKRIDSQIRDIVDENVFDVAAGDITKIYYIKENVKKKMDSKNQMLLSESTGSLQELADKRTQRENEINQNISSLAALDGGIVSYSFDGLEESLKIDSLNSITKEQTLMKQDDDSVFAAAGYVNAQEGVFKIVSSNAWYIAAYIDNADLDGWQEGDTRTIYIKNKDGNISAETQIYRISQIDDKNYVVFKLTKDIIDFINSRSVTFEINKAREGLKINSSAIVEAHTLKIPSGFVTDDGYVIKKIGDSTESIAVSISQRDENGEYVYVPVEYNRLNAQDEIVNPNDASDVYKITDMSTSKGVYVINTGVTEFKNINLENSVQNSTHTILDPSLNTNIKVYDRIVTDVKNIAEEQKIY